MTERTYTLFSERLHQAGLYTVSSDDPEALEFLERELRSNAVGIQNVTGKEEGARKRVEGFNNLHIAGGPFNPN